MSEEYVKKAAELLKMGATLLSDICPACNVPLIRFRGDVFCPKCGRKIILVRGESEAAAARTPIALADVEENLIAKILDVNVRLASMDDLDDIKKAGEVMNILLKTLSLVRKLRTG